METRKLKYCTGKREGRNELVHVQSILHVFGPPLLLMVGGKQKLKCGR
jgi:hypothetical protein